MWLIGRESTAQMTNAMPRLKPLVKDMNHRQLKCGTAAHHSQRLRRWRMRKLVKAGLAEQWGQTLSDKGTLVDVYAKKEKT